MDAAIITFVSAILGLVPPLINVLRGKPKPWLNSILQGVLSGTTAALVTYFVLAAQPVSQVTAEDRPQIRIEIQDPQNGKTIDCVFSEDQQCLFTVTGKATGLATGQRIYIFIKEQGGAQWWVSGGAIEPPELVNGEWHQPRASFGHRDSKVKDYVVAVLVTSQQYTSGQLLAVLPNDVLASSSVAVKRR